MLVEVVRREPAFEGVPEERPLPVDDGVPGRVPAAPLVHLGLTKDAFVAKAKALGGAARRRVQGVALPLIAAVAELEGALHHQVHRLGRRGGARERSPVVQVTDFDGTILERNSMVSGEPQRLAAGLANDAEKECVGRAGGLDQRLAELRC